MNLVYLYLIAPLHTGGSTQEGNLLGIARESHTELPYIPSSTIRGRLRATAEETIRPLLFGTDLKDGELEQGDIWIGDGSILWIPVPSLSHGVVWVTCPMLLRRWQRLSGGSDTIPAEYSTSITGGQSIYLKDAILKDSHLTMGQDFTPFLPSAGQEVEIDRGVVLPDRHCATLIQMSLWRQVKIKLDETKTVDGGFRYEEAIPPDTLMYFPWGVTSKAKGSADSSQESFRTLLNQASLLQIGGQESLGRGFVQHWLA
ncbi:type III-B CRISPR module RAMP protein Cmr4 [Lyngbya confervoides]|uniref:Type III-B CRISPR module RAMP protein Cmr4 n=1 Tax=Lyngbya confervoides BDU141951 TaxID=1574623 RepID=A0ABD4T2Z0_9CYAN|nr:type III-B CRISPR module RAMP protein Cmr4 [Lyngbya confervoides]MCM1982964.1 type III-B CRISPR module RAMP protein Cmr4 [Lyngbya confervoides BDU141951]